MDEVENLRYFIFLGRAGVESALSLFRHETMPLIGVDPDLQMGATLYGTKGGSNILLTLDK
jgi:hypothetical protein